MIAAFFFTVAYGAAAALAATGLLVTLSGWIINDRELPRWATRSLGVALFSTAVALAAFLSQMTVNQP